jgi:hypothetical protein
MLTTTATLDDQEAIQSPYTQLQDIQQEQAILLLPVEKSIVQARIELARLAREYKVNFDLMTDSELRENKTARLQLSKSIADLEKKKGEVEATAQDLQDIDALLQDAYGIWPGLPLERQRRFIRKITRSITLDEIGDSWLQLTIIWSPFLDATTADVAFIWRQRGTGKAWTPEEEALLRRHYRTAKRAWLLGQLPTRSWSAILTRAGRIPLTRPTQRGDTTLPIWMSLDDKRVMDSYELTFDDLSLDSPLQRVWWQSYVISIGQEGLG